MRSFSSWNSVALVAALISSALASSAHASSYFDFEDGTLQGWLLASTGGSGSAAVETHNGSKMAKVHHSSNGVTSLSHDVAFSGLDTVSFDMHAIAVIGSGGGGVANSYSGITVSFLNSFNISLGGFSLFNATSPQSLLANQYQIDNLQHTYAATLEQFAAMAGISQQNQIAVASFSFITAGQFTNINAVSSADVWFDNFQVASVPEPAGAGLFAAGLMFLAGLGRRYSAGNADAH